MGPVLLPQVILKSEPVHPFGLAVYGEHIFWTDWVRRAVQRANKYVGSDMKLLRVDIPQQPMGIIAVANDTNSCEWGRCHQPRFLPMVQHTCARTCTHTLPSGPVLPESPCADTHLYTPSPRRNSRAPDTPLLQLHTTPQLVSPESSDTSTRPGPPPTQNHTGPQSPITHIPGSPYPVLCMHVPSHTGPALPRGPHTDP